MSKIFTKERGGTCSRLSEKTAYAESLGMNAERS